MILNSLGHRLQGSFCCYPPAPTAPRLDPDWTTVMMQTKPPLDELRMHIRSAWGSWGAECEGLFLTIALPFWKRESFVHVCVCVCVCVFTVSLL